MSSPRVYENLDVHRDRAGAALQPRLTVGTKNIIIRPLTNADREAISKWRYTGDLSIYDPSQAAFDLREPDHVALASPAGRVLGYGTLGSEARVPGGSYADGPETMDVGMGLRPDLVGKGYGGAALLALMDHAEHRLSPTRFRATIAASNARATTLVLRLGFQPAHRFVRSSDGREFVQYERAAVRWRNAASDGWCAAGLEPNSAVLLEPYGAVYIEIAKVASSSLKATFAALLGLDLVGVKGNPHLLGYPRPEVADAAGDRIFPGLYSFGFVRNPWDRLVSCYRDKIGGEVADFTGMSASGVAHCLARFNAFTTDMSFDAFVDAVAAIPDEEADEHFRSQHCYLTNAQGQVAVDFIGRYEALASDFLKVAKKIGLPSGITLPRLQSNARPADYTTFYTSSTREVVAARFARDIDLFEYRFDVG